MKWTLGLGFLLASTLSYARLTVGTYNIRNFDYDERARIKTNKPELASILKGLNFDLLGVNEINNVSEFNNFVGSKLRGYDVALSNCGGAHGQHLGFVYNKAKLKLINFREEMQFSGDNNSGGCFAGSRPAAVALFEELSTRERFYAIQLHLKSGSNASSVQKRARQYQLLQKLVKDLVASGTPSVIAMGDINTTGYLDRDNDYRQFTSMLKNSSMSDLSSSIGCSAYWWGGSDDGIESPSLLDHVMATGPMLKGQKASTTVGAHCRAVSCREASPQQLGVSYTGVSDHCPQTATIR